MSMDRRSALAAIAALGSVPILGCDAPEPRRPAIRATPKPEAAQAPLKIIPSIATPEGKGAIVRRIFPTRELKNLDPFVLLDDFRVKEPAGFPTHPHRGFEAFTYMTVGAFHHVDNLGNDSVVGAGGVQRFTSGKGAYHSEMPGTHVENEGLQLWVNLPRRLKQMAPNYAGHDGTSFPVQSSASSAVTTIVGKGSDVELQTPVKYVDVTLASGASHADVIEGGWNALVYVLSGSITIAGHAVDAFQAALPQAGPIAIVAREAARFVLIAGKPHGEPILHHGPFVD